MSKPVGKLPVKLTASLRQYAKYCGVIESNSEACEQAR